MTLAQKPVMVAAMGARGTGKSAWVKQQIRARAPSRLLVWDLMAEHADLVPSVAALGDALRAMDAKSWALRVVPAPGAEERAAQFDVLCRAAMAAGRMTLYVEELAFVTRPQKSPAGWQAVTLTGRHRAIETWGTSQRPASVDKDFFGNLDCIHCGRQTSEADARLMGSLLRIPWPEMAEMPDLHYAERWAGDVKSTRGVLTFSKAPKRVARKPKGDGLRA